LFGWPSGCTLYTTTSVSLPQSSHLPPLLARNISFIAAKITLFGKRNVRYTCIVAEALASSFQPVNTIIMKRLIFLTALLGTVFLSGCEKSDIEHENAIDRGYDACFKLSESSGINFRYAVSVATRSASSCFSISTVRSGKVVQGDFQYEVFNDVRMQEGGWVTVSLEEFLQ